jgi:integrase
MKARKRKWKTSKGGKEAWVVVYAINGKRHQRTFDKKKEADAWIARAQLDIRNGTHVPDSASLTVREAGEQWIKACKNGTPERPSLERATWEGYEQHLKHHILPYLGDLKLSRLTPETVRSFEAKLAQGTPPPGADRARPRSRAMIKKIRSSLGALLAEARVPRNVVYEQRRPRSRAHVEQRHEDDLELGIDIPKPDEIRAIIKTLEDERWRRWRPLVLTAIFTGLRASELRGLRWKDVDLDQCKIQVRQRRDRYGDEGPPKSKAGRRTVPLTPKLVYVLREWKLACPKGGMTWCSRTASAGSRATPTSSIGAGGRCRSRPAWQTSTRTPRARWCLARTASRCASLGTLACMRSAISMPVGASMRRQRAASACRRRRCRHDWATPQSP